MQFQRQNQLHRGVSPMLHLCWKKTTEMRRRGKFFGFCCDSRRATIIVNILSLILFIACVSCLRDVVMCDAHMICTFSYLSYLQLHKPFIMYSFWQLFSLAVLQWMDRILQVSYYVELLSMFIYVICCRLSHVTVYYNVHECIYVCSSHIIVYYNVYLFFFSSASQQ